MPKLRAHRAYPPVLTHQITGELEVYNNSDAAELLYQATLRHELALRSVYEVIPELYAVYAPGYVYGEDGAHDEVAVDAIKNLLIDEAAAMLRIACDLARFSDREAGPDALAVRTLAARYPHLRPVQEALHLRWERRQWRARAATQTPHTPPVV